jgi:hypothetical protein
MRGIPKWKQSCVTSEHGASWRGKIATLRNKIALHENFMTVRPIAAGNSANKSGEKRGEPWNGNSEKFNDTALTSGKEGNLAVFGG